MMLLILSLFLALWDGTDKATVTFHLTSRACLYRQSAIGEKVFISCYEKPGSYRIQFGHGLTDGNYRPRAGDVYVLVSASSVLRTPLRGRDVYMSLVLR